MHLARFGAFHDQAAQRALAAADQMMVHRAGGYQRRNRCFLRVSAAVGQDQKPCAAIHRAFGIFAQGLQRVTQAIAAVLHGIEHRQGFGAQLGDAAVADLLQLGVAEHRRAQLQQPAMAGGFLENVALPAEIGDAGSDQGFTDGVQRRVGDLREQLFEIAVQQLRLFREHCDRGVHAH